MVNYKNYIDETKRSIANYTLSHEGYVSMQIVNAVANQMERLHGGHVLRWQDLCDEIFDNMVRDSEIVRRNYEWRVVGVRFNYPTLKDGYGGL